MIPNEQTVHKLWDVYALPEVKRNHSQIVADVALFLGLRVQEILHISIDTNLLYIGALLHDIDKKIPKATGEHHPATGVRILNQLGFGEVANLIKTHSLPAILDQSIAPKTWEEKLLFLSDKMVKHSVITVDERFLLWRKEDMPKEAIDELDKTYPKVKQLEKEVFSLIGLHPYDVAMQVKKVTV